MKWIALIWFAITADALVDHVFPVQQWPVLHWVAVVVGGAINGFAVTFLEGHQHDHP